jgi:hypothetical protein
MRAPLPARWLPRAPAARGWGGGMDRPSRHWWFWRPLVINTGLTAVIVLVVVLAYPSVVVIAAAAVSLFCGWSAAWIERHRFDRRCAAWERKNRWWLQ